MCEPLKSGQPGTYASSFRSDHKLAAVLGAVGFDGPYRLVPGDLLQIRS